MSRNRVSDQGRNLACDLARELESNLYKIRDHTRGVTLTRLTSNHFRAHRIDSTLDHVVALARDLATDLDFGNAVECDNALGSDVTLARKLAAQLDRARKQTRKLVRDLTLDRPMLLSKDRDAYASALALAHQLVHDFARMRNQALAVAQTVVRARGRATDLALLRELERVLAAFIARDDEDLPEREDVGGSAKKDIVRSALRLTCVATKVLPTRDRARYSEEWRAELWTLSQEEGTPQRDQVRYGLRVLTRSVGLRLALLWEPAVKRERV